MSCDPADERRRKKDVLNVDEMTNLCSRCAKNDMFRASARVNLE